MEVYFCSPLPNERQIQSGLSMSPCIVSMNVFGLYFGKSDCMWWIGWGSSRVILKEWVRGQKLAFVVVCNMNVSQNVCHQLVNPICLYFMRKKYGKTNKYSTTSILFCMFNNYPHEYSHVNRVHLKPTFFIFKTQAENNSKWQSYLV